MFVNALEGTLVLRKPLDYEALSNFSVDIRAQVRLVNHGRWPDCEFLGGTLPENFHKILSNSQDQGNPPKSSTTSLRVNVIDADDQNPAFQSDEYKVVVPRQINTVGVE